jgi:transcriptional regulator with XRE-family HTH domain
MSTSHDSPYRHYLREWRERRGLHQSQLAKMVGTSTSVISRFETGDRHMKLEMQFKLMGALGIAPAQFFAPPDAPSLDALAARETPERHAEIVKVVQALVRNRD